MAIWKDSADPKTIPHHFNWEYQDGSNMSLNKTGNRSRVFSSDDTDEESLNSGGGKRRDFLFHDFIHIRLLVFFHRTEGKVRKRIISFRPGRNTFPLLKQLHLLALLISFNDIVNPFDVLKNFYVRLDCLDRLGSKRGNDHWWHQRLDPVSEEQCLLPLKIQKWGHRRNW